jgi:hypothetical protein
MRILLGIIFFFCFIAIASTQEYYLRLYGGITYYHGDLSPQASSISFSDGHAAYGLYAGTKLSGLLTLGTRFLKGHLSASDADSQNPDRRRRNLHFKTDIYELGLISEFSFNHLFKNLNRYGINLKLVTGVNVYHYNPKALFEGKWIALQPLMTEGEGLRQYLDQKPYHLTRINFPLGMSVEFNLAYNFSFGIEITPRITFNDYLDDVSTVYITYEDIKELKGELAANLANRTGELTGSSPTIVPTGTPRGDPTNNDWYVFTGIYFSYIIGATKPVKKEIPVD